MKNTRKFLTIFIIFTVVFAFSACDEGGGNGGGSGNNLPPDESNPPSSSQPPGYSLGETLTLSGQVYTWNNSYIQFYGDRTVSGGYGDGKNSQYKPLGGSGGISGGQFTFSIGIPNPNSLQNINQFFDWCRELKNFEISNTGVKIAEIMFSTTGGDNPSNLFKENRTTTTEENVYFIYVDQDVNIRADKTVMEGGTFNAFNIDLLTGWNAIHQKWIDISTPTITMSAANPANLRWVLYE